MNSSSILNLEFGNADAVRRDVGRMIRPPRRSKPSEFAAEHVYIDEGVRWDPAKVPYMIRPMDTSAERQYEAVVFIGPARTGKTLALCDCRIGHIIAHDPADTMISQMTRDLAARYSKTRMSRMHEYSPLISEQIRLGTHDDNLHDKQYLSGMHLTIGWPSSAQYSGRDFKYVFVTDYDRIPESIGHEGSAFSLVQKRLQTFMSAGMGVYESSPRHIVTDEAWKPETSHSHELPPARGIVSLYNRGTREAFYFQCFSCREWFIPDFPEAFWWPDSADIDECAEATLYCCPHCGSFEDPARKAEFNANGQWCGDGQKLDAKGRLIGEARETAIASFRLGAGAAAYQQPQQLTRLLLTAEREYELTGSEEALRGHVGLDQGKPYRPKRAGKKRTADELQSKAVNIGRKVIPPGGRFLKFSIDVQQYHWAVLAVVWGVDNERWVIDRFDIRRSKRQVDSAYDPVQPAVYPEDWNLLISQVINKRYPLADGSGREMGAKLTCCDSHGLDGVTERAYDFWRRKVVPLGLSNRFMLVRGVNRVGVPRIRQTFPDSQRKDRKAQARGEIPIWQINTEVIKDSVNTDLAREDGGHLAIHLADTLPDSAFEEATAEVKDPKKGWVPVGKQPNETFDLLGYDRATAIPLNVEHADFWARPPAWAREWNENSLVVDPSKAPDPATPPKATRKPKVTRRLF